MRKTRRLVDDRSRIHRDSRLEIKYVLDAAGGDVVARRIEENAELALAPDGARRWEVKTIYYDVPDFELVRQTHAIPDTCIKVRTREYPCTSGGVEPERIWLEIKERQCERTVKIRFPVLRQELPHVLAGGGANGSPALDASSREARAELAAISRGRALTPVAEVRYWRRAGFHGESERITLDDSLRWRLLGDALARSDEDAVGGSSEDWFLEVKGGRPPGWLTETLEQRAAVQVSKLLIATAQLVASGLDQDPGSR